MGFHLKNKSQCVPVKIRRLSVGRHEAHQTPLETFELNAYLLYH